MKNHFRAPAAACALRSIRARFLSLAALLLASTRLSAAINVVEDFATDPLATSRWTFGVGNNDYSQYIHQSSAAAFPGDAPGSLRVHLNSTLPSARLDRSLGATLGDGADFTLVVQFSIANLAAQTDQAAQVSFGLVNHALTRGDRSSSSTTSGDAFHTVEFTYFPNLSTWNPATPGPTLGPIVIGADKGGGLFSNFAYMSGTDTDLGGNSGGQITDLPLNTNLQATLNYTASNKTITLEIARIEPDGTLTLLQTGVPVMDLVASGYDASNPFRVDSLAIMAYHDGWNESFTTPSIVADVTFERMMLTSPVPEPTTTALLLGAGLLGVARMRPRGRHLRRR